MLQHAIEKCGRDIVLSLSPGPALIEKAWHYETYANMWRITDDFWDTWELLYDCLLYTSGDRRGATASGGPVHDDGGKSAIFHGIVTTARNRRARHDYNQ